MMRVRVADLRGYTYIETNVHIVSESDFDYVKTRLRDSLGRDLDVVQISSTELVAEPLGDMEILRLRELKFVERVGRVDSQYESSRLGDLIEYLRSNDLSPVTRISDFSLRWRIVQALGRPRSLENIVLLRDVVEDDSRIILVVRPVASEDFQDLVDLFHDSYCGKMLFAACDLSSEHETVSCVRVCCALKVRLLLVNPRARFTSRKLLLEFKKLSSLCKARTFRDLGECVDWVKRRHGKVTIVGLSMHARRGEKTLERYLSEMREETTFFFVLGNETWGLSPRQVELCDIVVRLGPSTGVPMSVSESIAYVTHVVRRALSSSN